MNNWKNLESTSKLDFLAEMSKSKPVVIFKHSTRCGISAQVKDQLEAGWHFSPEQVDFYYLDLLAYREVSDEIMRKFGVVHQSPQVIVLKNGEPVYHASHFAIDLDKMPLPNNSA